jgi:guanosine-3',5'-bis(diphosphate) 3'-pyrophosphohydrolase
MPDCQPDSATGLPLILSAAAFAAERHRDQRRKDAGASPYINHPLALAAILSAEGAVEDPVVIAAALLHDTVEDTETTLAEIEARFGADVAGIVAEVTDDKDLPKAVRKALQVSKAAHKSPRAKLVKLADKIANLRDLAASPPADWPAERRAEYAAWSARVVEGLRGSNAALEAAFDGAHAALTHRAAS